MFKVPLYFWNKASGVRAARADLSSARYEYEAEKLATLARVRDLYSMAKTAEHHLHLYEAGIIPQARLVLQSATSNYQVGKTDFMALLDSENRSAQIPADAAGGTGEPEQDAVHDRGDHGT